MSHEWKFTRQLASLPAKDCVNINPNCQIKGKLVIKTLLVYELKNQFIIPLPAAYPW